MPLKVMVAAWLGHLLAVEALEHEYPTPVPGQAYPGPDFAGAAHLRDLSEQAQALFARQLAGGNVDDAWDDALAAFVGTGPVAAFQDRTP